MLVEGKLELYVPPPVTQLLPVAFTFQVDVVSAKVVFRMKAVWFLAKLVE